MKIFLSLTYIKKHRSLIKTNKKLAEHIKTKLAILLTNPGHPSLRIHKLQGKHNVAWSLSVDMNIRIVFMYTKDGILLTDIGSHDEIY